MDFDLVQQEMLKALKAAEAVISCMFEGAIRYSWLSLRISSVMKQT
jgi:hypothetical protein